jgi:predicted metal-dependent enzyme (double-stranded beta helix superfamily)
MNHAANLFAFDRDAAVRSSGGDACLLSQPTDAFARPCALERLCRKLDRAFDRSAQADEPSHQPAFARSVRVALAEAAADAALLTSAQRQGAADSYRRHLLAADPLGRYAIAALVWMPGQASRVHAHHTWCGYAVIEGTLAENIYGWIAADQCASEIRTHPRAPGAVSFTRAGYTGIHRLGNASDAPAISLHLYGVQGTQLATHVNDFVRVTDQRVSA